MNGLTPPPTPSPFTERGTDTGQLNDARSMHLSCDEMYERVIANDAAFNGRFFLGVLTTGIYCLPSCRARRPLRTNVDFFENVDAARAAGLRPCRRCHPDDF